MSKSLILLTVAIEIILFPFAFLDGNLIVFGMTYNSPRLMINNSQFLLHLLHYPIALISLIRKSTISILTFPGSNHCRVDGLKYFKKP